jgi:hypothetical protein
MPRGAHRSWWQLMAAANPIPAGRAVGPRRCLTRRTMPNSPALGQRPALGRVNARQEGLFGIGNQVFATAPAHAGRRRPGSLRHVRPQREGAGHARGLPPPNREGSVAGCLDGLAALTLSFVPPLAGDPQFGTMSPRPTLTRFCAFLARAHKPDPKPTE